MLMTSGQEYPIEMSEKAKCALFNSSESIDRWRRGNAVRVNRKREYVQGRSIEDLPESFPRRRREQLLEPVEDPFRCFQRLVYFDRPRTTGHYWRQADNVDRCCRA